MRPERALPMRVRIHQAAPAASIERRPLALRLRQAIGHRIDNGRVMAHAAMAALDFDALGTRGSLLHAALPGADAIGAAEDRGGRYRRSRVSSESCAAGASMCRTQQAPAIPAPDDRRRVAPD